MKRITMLALLLFMAAGAATAQETTDNDNDLQARMSVELDKKISKGFHITGGYQMRMDENITAVERQNIHLGASGKITDWLKAEGGGMMIIKNNSQGGSSNRCRFYGSLTGSLKAGVWQLSLREKLEMTHRLDDFNRYQETPNLLALKSRVKLQYKGFRDIGPYAGIEAKAILNGPDCTAVWNSTTGEFTDYEFLGYGDSYISRLRCTLGLEWEISKHNSLDFTAHFDSNNGKSFDVNAKGTKLKEVAYSRGHNLIASIGYKFSF